MIGVAGEVRGVKEALRIIGSVDKQARRDITKEYKTIVKPVIDDAKQNVPRQAPISGWARNWTTKSGFKMLPWQGDIGAKMIKPKLNGRKVREYGGHVQNLAVMSITWTGMVDTVFDIAGRGSVPDTRGQQMTKALSERFGKPSRVIWPAWERNADKVEKEIAQLIDKIMSDAKRALETKAAA
jgi:hypothetical protein